MAACAKFTTFLIEVILAQNNSDSGKTVDSYGFPQAVVCANITTLHD
jgi:hypothetical protein